MNTTTTIDRAEAHELHRERYGVLIGPGVWTLLADEYLHGEQTAVAQDNARHLGQYVSDQVRWTTDGAGRDFYVHHNVRWIARPGQPYDGLADLENAVTNRDAVVSTDHCDHPVWTLDTNLRFRIWHDTAHVEHQLGFSVDEELVLFARQHHELAIAHEPWACEALFCESVYQLAAFVSLGRYPDVQRAVELGPVGRRVRDLLLTL
jgi:hypothetical protein